jgi:hypothetical protein
MAPRRLRLDLGVARNRPSLQGMTHGDCATAGTIGQQLGFYAARLRR